MWQQVQKEHRLLSRLHLQELWPSQLVSDLERRFSTQHSHTEQQANMRDLSQAISDLSSELHAFQGRV